MHRHGSADQTTRYTAAAAAAAAVVVVVVVVDDDDDDDYDAVTELPDTLRIIHTHRPTYVALSSQQDCHAYLAVPPRATGYKTSPSSKLKILTLAVGAKKNSL